MLCHIKDLKKYLQIYVQILQQSKNIKAKNTVQTVHARKLSLKARWKLSLKALRSEFEGVCIYSCVYKIVQIQTSTEF